MGIFENYTKLRKEIPKNITIVVACKTRTKEEVIEVIRAGATDIGYNYVQEAEKMHSELGEYAKKVKWHMIGHLQSGKVATAVKIFDVIQSVDSIKIANEINKRAQNVKKIVPVLIEVNIARESQKSGILPEQAEMLVLEISNLSNLKLEGIMTMGSFDSDNEGLRLQFRAAKSLFDRIKCLKISNVNFNTLSMGMSDSYTLAFEEGANMVRIGTFIFGLRTTA